MKTHPDFVCRACGRPGRELHACPWCGERIPIARRTVLCLLLFLLATIAAALYTPFRGEGLPAGILFACASAPLPERHASAGAWLCLILFSAFSFLEPFPLSQTTHLGSVLATLPSLALLLRGGIPPVLPHKSRMKNAIGQWMPPAAAVALFAGVACLSPNPYLPLAILYGFWCRRMAPGSSGLFLFALGCLNPREIPFLLAGIFAGTCGGRLAEVRR